MKLNITQRPILPKTYFRDIKVGEWFQGTMHNSRYTCIKIPETPCVNAIVFDPDCYPNEKEGLFDDDLEVIRVLDVELSGRLES